MAIPKSKAELTKTLQHEYTKLETELATIPNELTREKTVLGGISICDIVAYQIGWGQLLIGWYETGRKGKMPALPAKDYKWNQLGELARHFYEIHQKDSYKKLLQTFRKVVDRVMEVINETTDKELYTIGVYNWTGDKWPLGRWINVNTSSPYKSARTKIRRWKKKKGLY